MNSQSNFTNPDHIYPNSHTHTSPTEINPHSVNGPASKPLRLFAGLKTRTHVRAGNSYSGDGEDSFSHWVDQLY